MTGAEIALLVGVGVGAYSTYQQGVSAKRQAEAEASFEEYNAKVAERQMEAERLAGIQEQNNHRRKARALISAQRAGYGKAGVAMTGSPLLVMEDTLDQLDIESAQIAAGGVERQNYYKSQSILSLNRASGYRAAGSNAYKSGLISAGGQMAQGMYSINQYRQSDSYLAKKHGIR